MHLLKQKTYQRFFSTIFAKKMHFFAPKSHFLMQAHLKKGTENEKAGGVGFFAAVFRKKNDFLPILKCGDGKNGNDVTNGIYGTIPIQGRAKRASASFPEFGRS